jgi:hypothetical protein
MNKLSLAHYISSGLKFDASSAGDATGYPRSSHPCSPPASGRTSVIPCRLSASATRALVASFRQEGTVNLSENRWKRLPLVALRRHAYPACGGGISEIIVKLTIPSAESSATFVHGLRTLTRYFATVDSDTL